MTLVKAYLSCSEHRSAVVVSERALWVSRYRDMM
jgi:hypothetical protein